MTQNSLKQAIAKAQQRLESLLDRATGEISAALLQEAIAEVSYNLEELQVLAEELETQNDELTATRAAVDAERQRYQDLFKITPDGYLVTDGAGIIQEANPAAAQLLNTERSYLVGKALGLFVHPKQRRQFRQILAQLGQQEQMRGEVRIFQSAKKIDFPAQLTGVAMRDTQGKLVSLCFLLRDISDRILAQESDNLVRTIVESEPECVKLVARDGTLLDMNPAGLAMIEAKSLAQVQGKSVYPLVVSEYRPAFQALTERVFQGESGILEFEIVGLKGTRRWLETHAVPFRNTQGEIAAVLSVTRDISDRKRLQIELQQSEAKLSNILNSAIAAIVSFRFFPDCDWEYIYWSAGCEIVFGFTPEELMADKTLWSSRVFPEDWVSVMPPMFEDFFFERNNVVEYRFFGKDGDLRWVRETYTSVREPEANYWIVTIVATDISDRKRVEAALAQKEEQLRLITDSLPAYISYFDASQRYQFVNKMYEHQFGLKQEQICRRHIREILGEDAYKVVQANIEQALAGNSITYEAAQPDPQLGTRYSYVTLISDIAQDAQVKGCYSLIVDITERKRLELALQQSEATLSDIINNAIASIVSIRVFTDGTWEYDYYSPSCEAIFGFTAEEMMTGIWWSRIPPEDQQSRIFPSRQYIFAQQPTRIEYRFLHKDGTFRWICSDISSRWDEANRCFRLIAVDIDISDRKQAEIELQKAKESAEAANIAKSTFLANMSHELRTPLNAILGFTQMMARDRTLSPQQQEQVKIINNAGDHLLALINDILEMSKIEAGRTSFNPTSFDLINFLSTLEELFKFKAESKGLQLKFELASDLPQYIQTDEGKLRQVLINILGNALKFTEKGQVTLRITQGNPQKTTNYQLPITNYQLVFEIEDSGFGIKPEEIDRIFDPFIQSETGKKAMQGTGLGLAISRKFVQMMGGDIRVNSQPNQGSLFTFDIQVAIAEAIEQNTNKTPRQVIGLAPNQPEYRILVVEDHPESRLLLTTLLNSIGFQVRQADNGQEAVEIWSTWQPHLIFMDMRMPVVDGVQATQQIRAKEKELMTLNSEDIKTPPSATTNDQLPMTNYPTIIIALTANAFESDKQFVLAIGCDDYISKPFQHENVIQKITEDLKVSYIYETDNKLTDKGNHKPESKITAEQLKTLLNKMPVDWLSTLHRNACIGNDSMIFELLEKIPPEDAPLAKALADLTENFEFDKIIELTQI